MARLLAITYAGLTLGAGQSGTDYHLTGKYSLSEEYGEARLSFQVVVKNATRATFLTSEATLITAYTKPDQDLTIVLDSTTRHTYSHSSNTGFNARPSISKVPGRDNTANSARYECSVVVQLPADLSGRAGRRSSSVDVSESPSGKKTAVIEGVYTALSSNAARTQFEAQVATYCNSVLTSLGGTWELVGQPAAMTDDQDKVIRFRRVYRELVFDQASGTRDHAAIVSPQLSISRSQSSPDAPTSLGDVRPFMVLAVEYSCSVRLDQTTDLDDLWVQTIRPHVLEQSAQIPNVTTVIVVGEQVSYDPHENRLSASLSLVADVGGRFFQLRLSVREKVDHGVILRPVWNGDPYARDKYQGLGSWVRTLTRTGVKRGFGGPTFIDTDFGPPPTYDGFELVRVSRGVRGWRVGVDQDGTPLKAISQTLTYVRANVQDVQAPQGLVRGPQTGA